MPYKRLPFSYARLSNNKALITTLAGEFVVCSVDDIDRLVNEDELPSDLLERLKTRHVICDARYLDDEIKLLQVKYRTKKEYLDNTSLLLMVVPTIECNCGCVYCQASSRKASSSANEMSLKNLSLFCDFVMALPHISIKIEFQGGEPTLDFFGLSFIVKRLSIINRKKYKDISYVVCTNMIDIDRQFIKFCKRYSVSISTSLDGPRPLHDMNRPALRGGSSYDNFIHNLAKFRKEAIYPSALLTITRANINHIENVIDTYVDLGFTSIYIRPLNNYGFAFANASIGYCIQDYLDCYRKGMEHIINLNRQGISIKEEGTAILLKKVLSPFCDGFVDMQNPTALGRMCLLVNHDGKIYPSDEARMIAEMGDEHFMLAMLDEDDPAASLEKGLNAMLEDSFLEGYPECALCAYVPYCGADPVKRYYMGKYSHESYCGRKKKTFQYIFDVIASNDDEAVSLFRKWAYE